VPGSSRVAPRAAVPARKMRLSDVCNRLSIRAPARCPIPDRAASPRRRLAAPPRGALRRAVVTVPPGACAPSSPPPASPRVELRLTANLQLPRHRNPPEPSPEPRPRFRSPGSSTAWSWGALIEALPCRASRRRLCRPRRACSSASDVLCRDRPVRAQPFDRAHVGHRQAPSSPRASSKTRDAPEPGRLPSTSTLSSVCLSRLRLAPPPQQTTGSSSARHRTAAMPPAGFERLFTHRKERDEPDSRWLDPAPSEEERWTGRLSSISATRTAREHHHEPSDPRSAPAAVDRPARAGPTGLGPRPPRRPLDPGGVDRPLRRDPRGPQKSFLPTSTGSSRARGRPAFAHRRLSLCPLR
jgi:hypothetical protein